MKKPKPKTTPTKQVIAKVRNDGKALRKLTDTGGNEIGIEPGETKALRIPAKQVNWIGANAPGLTVVGTREVA